MAHLNVNNDIEKYIRVYETIGIHSYANSAGTLASQCLIEAEGDKR